MNVHAENLKEIAYRILHSEDFNIDGRQAEHCQKAVEEIERLTEKIKSDKAVVATVWKTHEAQFAEQQSKIERLEAALAAKEKECGYWRGLLKNLSDCISSDDDECPLCLSEETEYVIEQAKAALENKEANES